MRLLIAILAGFCLSVSAAAQPEDHLIWTDAQIAELQHLVDSRVSDGLEKCTITDFDRPPSAADPGRRSRLASVAAHQLMSAYLEGCSPASARAGWDIASDDRSIDTGSLLLQALLRDDLTAYFAALHPRHPGYQALRAAYASEPDAARRATLAINMERWRWMPLLMGDQYLLVNAASFEVTLWNNGRNVKSWPVIVGKANSPTPVFDATVSAVILNPWWEIPASIAAEGIASMVRNRPSAARKRGYVLENGRYRQRPGPGNALGQMKLVMPNAYSVYLHDTPNKNLFSEPVRTFSHGCVRVGGAIDLAKTLLAGSATATEVDAVVASGTTTRLPLAAAVPVYIGYFTAEGAVDGTVRYFPDVYKRDRLDLAWNTVRSDCAA